MTSISRSATWIAAALALGLLTGCASDIMQTYLGQPLEAAMARYGPPDASFDLPDGRRAYQWAEVSTTVSPGYAVTRTRRDGGGGSATRTELSPPTTSVSRCFYTMYARQDPATRGWVFDSFEPPALGC